MLMINLYRGMFLFILMVIDQGKFDYCSTEVSCVVIAIDSEIILGQFYIQVLVKMVA